MIRFDYRLGVKKVYLTSSLVLGSAVTSVTPQGEKVETSVFAGGAVVAKQKAFGTSDTADDAIDFKTSDPVTGTAVTYAYSPYSGGTASLEEHEPLGQRISLTDPEVFLPETYEQRQGWATEPEWQCMLPQGFYGKFQDLPEHCQMRALLAADSKLPWEDETTIRNIKVPIRGVDSPIPRPIDVPGGSGLPSDKALAFAKASTAKDKVSKGGGSGVELPPETVEVKIPPFDMSEIPGADASQDREIRDIHIPPLKKINLRPLLPLPLHPVRQAYKDWLTSGIDQACVDALNAVGLWGKILKSVENVPVYDVNVLGNEQVSKYWGPSPKWNGKTFGQYWPADYGAYTHTGNGKPGIYVQGGLWAFDSSGNPDNSYFFLHEHAHFVQPVPFSPSQDLDMWLADKLRLKYSTGQASAALNDYFNNNPHCKK